MMVSVGVSNRHVHLTEDTYKKLFGTAQIENIKELKQPGQYASNSFVNLKTEKGTIEHVRILTPFRDYNQVEISKTDSYKLGLNPPIRDSGDLNKSESITLIGPLSEIHLEEGCIIATRHIHILPEQIKQYNLEGKTEVMVKVNGEKGGILNHVHLKVSDKSYLEMHIDTDDSNANLLKNGDIVEIL